MRDVAERFAQTALKHSGLPAVIEDHHTTTYGDLLLRSRVIQTHLRELGGQSKRVLIALPQSASAYASMFAALFEGWVYAPVNVRSPLAKINSICAEFVPDVVMTNSDFAPNFRDRTVLNVQQLEMSEMASPFRNHPQQLEDCGPVAAAAYVIFTSGSTGVPKGVVISRKALSHYLDWAALAIEAGPGDRWSQHPSIAFDLSVLDIYGALTSGAALCPLASEKDRLMPALAIRQKGITVWNSVPSVIGLMMRARQMTAENFASLRLLTFCGEPLLPQHVEAIYAAKQTVTVLNTYGPTEATVSCTELRLSNDTLATVARDTLPFGPAIGGMKVILANEHGLGDEPEVVIIGPQLSDGYINPPANGSPFRMIHLEGRTERAYFTGDLAQRVGEHLYFSGRNDSQVKVAGHRIELEEINHLIVQSGATACASVVIDGKLHAFYEAPIGEPLAEAEMREALQGRLDAAAIPSYFHAMRRLPRNDSDKIDRLRLVEMVRNGVENFAAWGMDH